MLYFPTFEVSLYSLQPHVKMKNSQVILRNIQEPYANKVLHEFFPSMAMIIIGQFHTDPISLNP